jgi:hypothetical protein
VEFEDEG